MNEAKPATENVYTLIMNLKDLFEAISNEYLGANLEITKNKIFLEDYGYVETKSLDIDADEQEELVQRRQEFYEDFKELHAQLSLYDQYHGIRFDTLLPPSLADLQAEGEIQHNSSIILHELNMEADERKKSIQQINEEVYGEQKNNLLALAEKTPTTSQLYAQLANTLPQSRIYWSHVSDTRRKKLKTYFKQIKQLLKLAAQATPDEKALHRLTYELLKAYTALNYSLINFGWQPATK